MENFGLAYLTSFLRLHGIEVLVYNADYPIKREPQNVQNINYRNYNDRLQASIPRLREHLTTVLSRYRPRIVGISTTTLGIPSSIITANIIKETSPECFIVVGGPGPTITPHEYKEIPSVDAIVSGEGEFSMLDIASTVLGNRKTALSEIDGIYYRSSSGQLEFTRPRKQIDDLDTIPFPDRTRHFYMNGTPGEHFYTNSSWLHFSRGCPYGCKFCSTRNTWGKHGFRMRSLESSFEEIRYLYNTYNQRKFCIYDDLFTVSTERVMHFCEKIRKEHIDISWEFLSRIDRLSLPLIRAVKDAGCRRIQIGVETASERLLELSGKKTTLLQIRDAASLLHAENLDFLAFFIIGFPSETKDEILDTLAFIDEIKPHYVDLSAFTPFPGTDYYEELKKEGKITRLLPWDNYNGNFNYTGTMSDLEYRGLVEHAFDWCVQYNAAKR